LNGEEDATTDNPAARDEGAGPAGIEPDEIDGHDEFDGPFASGEEDAALDSVSDDDEPDAALDSVSDDDDPVAAAGLNPVEAPLLATPSSTPGDVDVEDEDLLADEVEASLDVILADRMRSREPDLEEDDEEEDDDDGTPTQLATVIPVRRPDEFLCQSCFLLKPPGQLADRDHQLCRDCA
jgi:hypothetical protein